MQGEAFWRGSLHGAAGGGDPARYQVVANPEKRAELVLPSFEDCCARPVPGKKRFSLEPRLYPPPKRQRLDLDVAQAKNYVDSGSNKAQHTDGNLAVSRDLCSLWTHKYRPCTRSEIVGNQALITRLYTWLQAREDTFLLQRKTGTNMKRGVMISGPPGVGKTSAALAVCNDLNFTTVLMGSDAKRRASDVRGDNQRLTASLGLSRKVVLIADEMDNMDENAIQAVLRLVQRGKFPVLCICNNKYDKKFRRLLEHCMVLKFQKPRANEILKLLIRVQEKESLHLDKALLSSIIDSAHRDVRHALNQMQYACTTYSATSGVDLKDVSMNSFETLDSLCSEALTAKGDSHSLETRLNFVCQDAGFFLLLVQENYLSYKPCKGASILNSILKVSDHLCIGDVIDKSICRAKRELSGLLSLILLLTCSSILRGTRYSLDTTENQNLRFPIWLSKNAKKMLLRRADLDIPSSLKEKTAAADGGDGFRIVERDRAAYVDVQQDLFALLKRR